MDLGDDDERRPTIADVPGLIEGASSGAGLGHAFLRHVERTRILVHVVDGSSRDPEWDYDVIREELRAHDPALLEKPMLVAFNKLDLPAAAEAWPAFRRARDGRGRRRASPSRRRTGDGLDAFRARIADAPARRRRARRAARAGRASSSTGSRRWATASASSSTPTAPSGSAARGSSGSPPRPTSTSRNRPSGSSATWPGSGSTPSCAGPGSPPATGPDRRAPSSNGRRSPGSAS